MLDQRRAIQMYLENRDKFPGMSQSDAVGLIRRSGGLPAAGAPAAPASAIAAAVPAQEAPAPAPPPPPQAYVTPQQAALAGYTETNPVTEVAPPKKGAPVDYAAMIDRQMAEGQRAELARRAAIAQAAQADPRLMDLIAKREARTDEELAQVGEEREQAIWMAIAQAGMKMAQSQSPYFMQALASGMDAGLTGYSEAKAKAAEKKARLQDAKEELTIRKLTEEDKARQAALNEDLAATQGVSARQQLEAGAIKSVLGKATLDDAIAAAELGNEQTRAQIANIYSTIGERRAAGARAEEAARSGGGGGAGGVKLSQIGPIVNGAISENNRLAEQLNDPVISAQMSPAEKQSIKAKMQSNDQIIQYGRSIQKQKIGMGSGFRILGPG
jgi:hypothetical protein